MINKITILVCFIIVVLGLSSFAKLERSDAYRIDAAKNATYHNNLGLLALENKDYYGAIEEFNIAIKLNPKSQATAVYYNNLGETYLKLHENADAQLCFERAINQFNLNLLFYQNLVKTFKNRGILNSKISEYKIKSEKNPLSKIILGLCYIQNGQVRNGIIILDSFCMSEPDLIITYAIKAYIKEIVKSLK